MDVKPDSNYNDLLIPQNKEQMTNDMADLYRICRQRIDKVLERHDNSSEPYKDYILREIYGFNADDNKPTKLEDGGSFLQEIGEIEKDELVLKFISNDLLFTTMYNPDGTISQLHEQIARWVKLDSIDIFDYEPIPKKWSATKAILELKAPDGTKSANYSGSISENTMDTALIPEDPVERNVRRFTANGAPPYAIAIPFSIDIGASRCTIYNNTAEFIPPWGGRSCERIVFIKK